MAIVKSCRICPKVYIEATGKYTDSELFQELYRVTGKDRKLTKRLYALSLNKEFRKNNGFNNSDKQNEIGEPELRYFLDAIGMKEDSKSNKLYIIRPDGTKVNIDVIGLLNEKIHNDRRDYTYDEAIEKVTTFNNDRSDVRRGFIATFEKTGKNGNENTYSVSIVKDTFHNRQNLIGRVKDEELGNKLSFFLKRLGITYTFENDKELSSKDVIDGFYNLIKISTSELSPEELSAELAFKSGVLAYKIMSDNPAMKSLRSALADSRMLEEYKTKYGDQNMSEEELIGHILADGFKKNLDERTYIRNKVDRAWMNIKNFFSKLFRDKHYVPKKVLMREIEMSTKEIIKSFSTMDVVSDEDLPTVIKLDEPSLLDFSDSEKKAYLRIKEQLTLAAKQFEVINPKVASEFKSFLSKVYAHPENFKKDEFGNTIDSETQRFLLMDKIAEAIKKLATDLSYTIDANLDKCVTTLDIDNPQPWLDGFNFTRKSLGTAREYLRTTQYSLKALSQMIDELGRREAKKHPDKKISVSDVEVLIGGEKVNLRSLQTKLETAQSLLETKLMGMERDFFAQFLAFSDGSNAIMQNARIIYHGPLYKGNMKSLEKARKEKNLSSSQYKKPRLYRVKDELITINEMLESTEDISLFSRFIASMSNNEDILGTKIDKLAKRMQKESIDKTYDDVRTILALKEEGIKLGLSKDLHEIIETAPELDENGIPTGKELPTGNFIQKLNYGMWEDDWQEFKESLIKSKEFQEEVNRVKKESHIVRGLAYEKLIKEKRKAWHKEHSRLEEGIITTQYVPNDGYKNPKWEALTDDQKRYVEKWIAFKRTKEERIYRAVSHRLPQMSGAAIATLSQHIDREGFLKGIGSAVFPRLKAALTRRLDPQEFGTDANYNKPEEDVFSTELSFELEKIHRLPVYGVNKYNKEDRKKKLSTNIVNTMIAYCVMANTYNCFEGMVSALEIGRTVLEERDSGINGIRKHNGMSGAYYRFDKFMDKQVYNINTTLVKNSNTVNVLINGFNSLAAICYLGGNIPGGLVNVSTGIRQLITESAVGEFVSFKSMMEAFGIYAESIVPMMIEDLGGKAGIGMGLNKMSIFIDKMNALGDAKFELSSYEDGFAGWMQRVLSPTELAMLPYSAGEKLMQGVTYVAVAKDTPVYNLTYNKQGKATFLKSNVWEMYSKVKEKNGKGVHKYILEQGDGNWIVPSEKYNTETIAKHYQGMLQAKEHLQKLQTVGKKDLSYLIGTSLTAGNSDIEEALTMLGIQRDTDVTMKNINTALYRINKFLEDVSWNSQKESDMMDVAREVNNRLHGIYNNQDKTAFSSNVFTNALLVMKNYVLGYIQNSFAPDHYSEVFKKNVEGTFVTWSKVALLPFIGVPDLDARKTNYHFLQGVRMTLFPYSKNTQNLMKQLGFSENQAYNMKRNLFYVLSSLFLSFIKMLSANPEKKKKRLEELDSKEKGLFLEARKDWKEMQIMMENAVGNDPDSYDYNEKLWGHIHYLSGRVLWELNSYLAPKEMFKEMVNVTTLYPVALSAAADIIKITNFAISGDTYNRDDPNLHYEKDDKKWKIALIKKIPYWKSWYWIQNPYEAYDSYEFANSLRKGR